MRVFGQSKFSYIMHRGKKIDEKMFKFMWQKPMAAKQHLKKSKVKHYVLAIANGVLTI